MSLEYNATATELHRQRFKLGDAQRTRIEAQLDNLDGESFGKVVMANEELVAGRMAVWAAEHEALRRDPQEQWLPPERTP